jgi:glucose-6-phosphate isomerase
MFAGRGHQQHRAARGLARAAAHASRTRPRPAALEAQELAKVHGTLDAMLAYAEQPCAPTTRSPTSSTSASAARTWGRKWPCSRLQAFAHPGKRFHFVSNVDGHELASTLARLQPAHTLFLIASKTFTTHRDHDQRRVGARPGSSAHGGTDIARALRGLDHQRGSGQGLRHRHHLRLLGLGGRALLAVVSDRPAALPWPLAQTVSGSFWPGRTPWMAISAAHPWPANLPVRLGLLDVWYRNFHRFSSRSVAPYHSALRRLPAYLQQLEMESNGKRVDASGEAAALRNVAGALGRIRHQRAARLLSDAAPGNRRGASGICRGEKSPAHACTATMICCWPMCWHRPRR